MISNSSNSRVIESGESQNYLASVSDLMSGLLFIFIITLMVFALSLKNAQRASQKELEELKLKRIQLEQELEKARKEQTRLERLVAQLTDAKTVRALLLVKISESLQKEGFQIHVDTDHGILHLPEEVLFPSGKAELQPDGKRMLLKLAEVLQSLLPEYLTSKPIIGAEGITEATSTATVDSIFVEGHTDNVPVSNGNRFKDNWDLSAARAIATYQYMTNEYQNLESLRNIQNLPLFSVSGYAELRPVTSNDSEDDRRRNRRIDLRFLMSSPKITPEILEAIQRSF